MASNHLSIPGVALEFERPNVKRAWQRANPVFFDIDETRAYDGVAKLVKFDILWITAHARWAANMWIDHRPGESVDVPHPNMGEVWLCTVSLALASQGNNKWTGVAMPEQFLKYTFPWTWDIERPSLASLKARFADMQKGRADGSHSPVR